MKNLILASGSPRRLGLLAQIQIVPVAVHVPAINEAPIPRELPQHYAKRMAETKANTVANLFPDKTILAADTVVICGRTLIHKPENEQQAEKCLKRLSGRRHTVITAVVILHNEKQKIRLVKTSLSFKRLSEEEIKTYLESREWEDKAGGYAIQGLAGAFISSINGSYTNVVGLPLYETRNMLMSCK